MGLTRDISTVFYSSSPHLTEKSTQHWPGMSSLQEQGGAGSSLGRLSLHPRPRRVTTSGMLNAKPKDSD